MAESSDTAVINTITYEDLKIQVGRVVTALNGFTTAMDALTAATNTTNTKLDLVIEQLQLQTANANTEPEGTDPETPEESVDTVAATAASSAMDTKISEVLMQFTPYTFGVSNQTRTSFLSASSFESYREGQSIDFTREFVLNYGTVTNTSATEYILLLAESSITTSSVVGSTDIERVRAWKDVKSIQTIVIIKNTIDGSASLYFPTKDSFTDIEAQKYNTEKKALDAAVKKYQTLLEDEHASIVIVPASSIERDILQSEYLEQAKLITPMCEYN